MIIRVQKEDFNIADINAQMRGDRHDAGAIASFTGLVRDLPGLGLKNMTLEHYPGMTENALADIVEKARQRWDIINCAVIHRVGELKPGDQIVLVSVLTAHRREAFLACEFVMDYLKTEAPFWKKETDAASSRWVAAKSSDDQARNRW